MLYTLNLRFRPAETMLILFIAGYLLSFLKPTMAFVKYLGMLL